jgi:hypothetical protein
MLIRTLLQEDPLIARPMGVPIYEFPTIQQVVESSRFIMAGKIDSPDFQPDPQLGDYYMFSAAFITPDTAYVWDRVTVWHALAWQTITRTRQEIKGAPVYLLYYDKKQLVIAPSKVSWNDGDWTNKRRSVPSPEKLTYALRHHKWIQSLTGVTVHGVAPKEFV